MQCFWRYKVLLYSYTKQFLNYTISLHLKYYFFMIRCIYALVHGLHFCVKIFGFMPDSFFFFKHEENIFLLFLSFTFPIHFIVGSN